MSYICTFSINLKFILWLSVGGLGKEAFLKGVIFILKEEIMANKGINSQNNSANQQNANKGTSGTNRQYSQVQGNRGKQLNPNQQPSNNNSKGK